MIRREKGTINRFIYTIAILAPPGSPAAAPDLSLWNGRLLYAFDGGVAIGHQQGTIGGGSHLYDPALSKGYAVDPLDGQPDVDALQPRARRRDRDHDEGAVHRGLRRCRSTPSASAARAARSSSTSTPRTTRAAIIDAAIPQYSYPDMVTQTIHVGDCELLEHFMDVTDGANPKWATWPNRTWLEGMNASATVPNPYRLGAPGNSECVRGWRGLTPLALNPHYGSAGAEQALYDPAAIAAIKWTHWDDLRNVYGVGPDGFARVPWDNTGVQYGLRRPDEREDHGRGVPEAERDGRLLEAPAGDGAGGLPVLPGPGLHDRAVRPVEPAQHEPVPDGGVTPAVRKSGDVSAMNAAYTSGIVFRGKIDIPTIDWRHYLEAELDMHNSHQSFASRQRMLNYDGDASNQVIWFTDARPARASDQSPLALAVIDEWMANIRAQPGRRRVAGTSRPPRSTRASRRTAR